MVCKKSCVAFFVCMSVVSTFGVSAMAVEKGDGRFYRAYYAEHAEGDLEKAADLYAKVARDGHVDGSLRSKAEERLAALREELAAVDFARLMPPNTLVYAELTRPGDQLMKLLDQLGVLSDGSLPPAVGGRQVAISPVLIKETLGIRGAAVAITGFNPIKQMPSGVAVFHHGDLDVIRGLIETGLPMGANLIEPIGGFPTYDVEGQVLVTLTHRLVIASAERSQIENVVRRLKGELDTSLATTNMLADYADARGDSLAFFVVNAKPLMPMVKAMAGALGGQGHEMALMDALLDPDSLQSLIGQIRVRDDGVELELALRMDEGHRSLVYNLLRTPAINKETLKCVPADAAAFAVGAMNEASSRYMGGESDSGGSPVVTLLDLGREIFANVTSFSIFVLPSERGAASMPMFPDVGLVLTVNDPSKSEALWTQMLGIASLASGGGAIEGASREISGVAVRSFKFPEGVTVYYATVGNDVLIGGSASAIGRSIDAKRKGRSVLDDDRFSRRIADLSPSTTKGLFVHAGRCAEIAKAYMPASEAAELSKMFDALSETVVSLSVEHSDQVLRFSARMTGVPDISDVLAGLIDEEMRREELHQTVSRAPRRGDWNVALSSVDHTLSERP